MKKTDLTLDVEDYKALIVSRYKPYKRISYRGIETMLKRLGEEIYLRTEVTSWISLI